MRLNHLGAGGLKFYPESSAVTVLSIIRPKRTDLVTSTTAITALWSDGLMVSGLDYGTGTLCCVLEEGTTLTLPHSTHMYRWVLAN